MSEGYRVASAEVIRDDPLEDSYRVEYTEPIEVVDVQEQLTADFTFNVAVIFVLSMIFGLLVFSILSRRWHS